MRMYVPLTQLRGVNDFIPRFAPIGDLFRDGIPKFLREEFFLLSDGIATAFAQKRPAGVLDAAQGEEFGGSIGYCRPFHLRRAAKGGTGFGQVPSQLRTRIAVVVEGGKRVARTDRILVQVGKHLLASAQLLIQEKKDRDIVLAQIRVLAYRSLNCRSTVLAIVYENACIHRHAEDADRG